MLCNICEFDNIPIHSTGVLCFYNQICSVNKEKTADEYDDTVEPVSSGHPGGLRR